MPSCAGWAPGGKVHRGTPHAGCGDPRGQPDQEPADDDPAPAVKRPQDLVRRAFTAPAPDCSWEADITYIGTFSGWVHAALVLEVFSGLIVAGRSLAAKRRGVGCPGDGHLVAHPPREVSLH